MSRPEIECYHKGRSLLLIFLHMQDVDGMYNKLSHYCEWNSEWNSWRIPLPSAAMSIKCSKMKWRSRIITSYSSTFPIRILSGKQMLVKFLKNSKQIWSRLTIFSPLLGGYSLNFHWRQAICIGRVADFGCCIKIDFG